MITQVSRLKSEKWINSNEKRGLDLALVGALMPIALPVGSTALGLSRLVDGGETIFRQTRIGRDSRPVTIKKIRTMQHLEEGRSEIDDPSARITRLGAFYRPISIDEILQMENIIKGEMSFVGPRLEQAHVKDQIAAVLPRNEYDEWEDVYNRSIPGGFSTFRIVDRSCEFDDEAIKLKSKLDIADFKNASLCHDVNLIFSAGRMAARHILKTVYNKA
jgi:lipopolysaccharide/colanic/teichoic acid biosynthesis glycosyltransferase